jgi:tetratricopeptide (TPR) repeat protein
MNFLLKLKGFFKKKPSSNEKPNNKKASSFNVMVKTEESRLSYLDYLNFLPEIKFSFLPGIFNQSLMIKIFAYIFYAICLMFILDKNFLVAIVLYCIPLIVNALKVKRVLKENGLRIKKKNKGIAILVGFVFVLSLIILLFTPSYKSAFLANGICNAADYLERRGFEIDKYKFYHAADILSGYHPLPYLKKGILLFERGEIEKAKINIEKARETEFENEQVYYLMGRIAFMNENYREAEQNFAKAYQMNPSYVPLLTNYAMIFLNKGDLEQAERLIERAMSRGSNDFEVNRVKGNILLERGLYEEALQYFDKAISLNPGLSHLHADKARALVHIYRIDEAEESVDIALNIHQNSFSANFIKGLVLFRQNKFNDAITNFLIARRGPSDVGIAQAYLTLSYLKKQDFQNFEIEMNRLLEFSGEDSEMNYVKSLIYFEQYNLEMALAEIKKAIELNNNRAKYYSLKADIYFEMDLFKELEAANSMAWRIDDNDMYAYYVRAKYLLYVDNYEAAHDALSTLYEMDPYSARVNSILAYTYNAINEREIAYELIGMAIEIDPNDYYVLYMKSLLDFERRRFQSALKTAEKGLELNPNFHRFHLIRARSFRMIGESENALEEIKKSSEIMPNTYSVLLTEAEVLQDNLQALEKVNNMIIQYPDGFEAYLIRAQRLLLLGDIVGAREAVNSSLSIIKPYVSTENEIIPYGYRVFDIQYKIAQASGVDTEIRTGVANLLQANPYYKDAYYFEGLYLQNQRSLNQAELSYKRALETESNFYLCKVRNTDIYAMLLEIYVAMGDQEKARDTRILLERLLSSGLDL